MKLFRIAFLPIFLIASLTSCEVQEVDLVSVEKIKLVSMKNNVLTFDVNAIIDNPNTFNIKLLDSELDLYLEKNLMGEAHLLKPVQINKKSSESYLFQIETGVLDQKKLLPILFKSALTGKINVGVKGDVKGKVYFLSKKVKIDMEDVVDINKDLISK